MHGGIYQLMKQDEGKKNIKLDKNHIKFILKFLLKYKLGLLLSFLCIISLTALELYNPIVVKNIIDIHIEGKDIKSIVINGCFLLVLSLIIWIVNYFQVYIGGKVGQGIIYDMRKSLTETIMKRKMDFFVEHQTGEIVTIINNDIKAVSDAFSSDMMNLLKDLFVLVSVVLIMFRINYKLAMIVILSIPVLFVSIRLLGNKIRSGYKEVKEKIAALNISIEENMSGIREIKALSVEKKKNDEFIEINESALSANLKLVVLMAMFFPIIVLVNSFVVGMILWLGGYEYSNGLITLGVISLFINYSRKFFMPIKNLSQVYNIYQSAAVSLVRIYDYFQYENLNYTSDIPKDFDLKIRNLKFSYENEEVLNIGELDIKSGEIVAVVGDSGSGKSTFGKLLSGLYYYENGSIKIGDVEVSSITPENLTNILTYVNQSTKLFRGSILENIKYSNGEIEEISITELLKEMNISDRINDLQEGLNTKIKENQVGISGGQKQLVSLIRSIIKENKIVVFDEITSSLDLELEKNILNYFHSKKDRTMIFITHRINGIQACDKIVFMRDGMIIDYGRHEELIKNCEPYMEFCSYQDVKQ